MRSYKLDKTDFIWDSNYECVGSASFFYDLKKARTVKIISDVDLIIRSNGLGNTIVNYSPTDMELF